MYHLGEKWKMEWLKSKYKNVMCFYLANVSQIYEKWEPMKLVSMIILKNIVYESY